MYSPFGSVGVIGDGATGDEKCSQVESNAIWPAPAPPATAADGMAALGYLRVGHSVRRQFDPAPNAAQHKDLLAGSRRVVAVEREGDLIPRVAVVAARLGRGGDGENRRGCLNSNGHRHHQLEALHTESPFHLESDTGSLMTQPALSE